MDKSTIESLKGKSREERLEYFNKLKSGTIQLSAHDLEAVNGGESVNPDSSAFGDDYYFTSLDFVCQSDIGFIRC